MERFSPSQEAVSPVVGTILMIAIAVVLAGVLFVLVSGFTATTAHPGYITFVVDEVNDQLRVTKFEGDPLWSEYEIKSSVAGDFETTGQVGAGADALVPEVFIKLGGAPAGPADVKVAAWMSIALCTEPAANDVYITIRHVDPNSLVFQGRFSNLRDCPA